MMKLWRMSGASQWDNKDSAREDADESGVCARGDSGEVV